MINMHVTQAMVCLCVERLFDSGLTILPEHVIRLKMNEIIVLGHIASAGFV